MWWSLTQVWFLFAFCPHEDDAAYVSRIISFGSIWISTSSASGIIATVTVEVWTLPLDSVSGILWTLWTHDSNFIREYTAFPAIFTITNFTHQISESCSSTISGFQPFLCA